MSRRRHRRARASLVAIVLIALAGGFSPASGAPTHTGPTKLPERVVPPGLGGPIPGGRADGLPADDRARGLVWTGLTPGQADGPCPRLFEVRTVQGVSCTHGPDMPPAGVEVTNPQLPTLTAASTALPCIGDGSDGNRVQAVYAHASDVPDRYDTVAPIIRDAAARVEQVFADSAAETGGVRQVRWVTDGACNLVIERVELSAAGDDTINTTEAELQAIGLNRVDRKYLIWMDSTLYCGIGTIRGDNQPGQANLNNHGPSYSRVDSGCWGLDNPVEAHELMHNLGGVQWETPHGSMVWHCTDDSDRMCYQDAASVSMTYTCPVSHERLFDCNHDDYFHTNPPEGSYLATHWNTAMSSFLVDPSAPLPPPTSTTTTTSTTTISTTTTSTTTTIPPRTATVTYNGSLSRRTPSKSYDAATASGTMVVTLSFTKASTMTVTVLGPNSTVLAQKVGPSPLTVSVPISAGTNRITVSSGGANASYTVSAAYPF